MRCLQDAINMLRTSGKSTLTETKEQDQSTAKKVICFKKKYEELNTGMLRTTGGMKRPPYAMQLPSAV